MFTTVTLQLTPSTLLRLVEQLNRGAEPQDMSETIATAIEFWLDAQNQSPGADSSNTRGYQWKSLFLPEGTVLRSWSYGEHNYARVEGDKIIHEGVSVSPNQFARSFARTTRNAWFDLSVRRPGDKRFIMAGLLRKELQAELKAQETTKARPSTAPEKNIVAAATPALAPAAPAITPPETPKDDVRQQPLHKADFDPGWNLPERRKFRQRIEDIAY